ncbi:unnamed protein product [Closterium sp. NIES-53]
MKVLPGTTPFEAWTGTKPNLSRLRTFGCLCYYHVPDPLRHKLQPKARAAIYLGIAANERAWRVWDLGDKRVVTSWDVVFDEDKFPTKEQPTLQLTVVLPAREGDEAIEVPPQVEKEAGNGGGENKDSDDDVVEVPPTTAATSSPPSSLPLVLTRERRTLQPSIEQPSTREFTPKQHLAAEKPPSTILSTSSPPVNTSTVVPVTADEPLQPVQPPNDVPETTTPPTPPNIPDGNTSHKGITEHSQRPTRACKPVQRMNLALGTCFPIIAKCTNPHCMECKVVAMCHAISCLPPEPSTRKQALASAERAKWIKGERDEINSLLAQGTWVLAPLPLGKRALKVKWTYRMKVKGDGTLNRFKACLVAKGFSQMPGTDYTETFSAVAKYTTVRCLLVMATVKDLHIHQMDVKKVFLYGKLDKEIYMVQPKGYSDGTTNVCKLLKSLYGLKQAPQVWFHTVEVSLLTQGFTKSQFDAALYILCTSEGESLWLLVYVDDILLVSASLSLLTHIKGMLTQDFIMTDMGEPSHYLGMNIVRDRTTKSLFISQQRYTEKVLSRFGLLDCNPVETPLPSDFTLSSHEQSIDPSTVESQVTELEGEVESLEPPEDIGHDTYAP